MIELKVNLWDEPCDARCITTNGTVIRPHRNVMGAGCALEALQRHPGIDSTLGMHLEDSGNHTRLLPFDLIAFPTKMQVWCPSTLHLILRSAHELMELIDLWHFQKVLLPRPGCGYGGLSWEGEVKLPLSHVLDDRVRIVDFPRKV